MQQSHTGGIPEIGAWLFKRRTIIPLPLALIILLTPAESPASAFVVAAGVALVVCGEGVRLWGVHHIGVISRTRSDRLGPLIDSGPFSYVRNPLYLGNILLWAGLAMTANLLWLAPLVVLVLALEYHAIVRWEEQLLDARLGAGYRAYAARVPRWLPSWTSSRSRNPSITSQPFSWGATLYSERGTLIAIGVGFLLLWGKGALR